MRRPSRTQRFLLIILVLVAATAGYLCYRRADRRQKLYSMAGSAEIDSAYDFDAKSGLLAFANESGVGGLFVFDTRQPGKPVPVPSAVEWPRQPVISPGGRWIAYHDFDPREDVHERTLYLTDRQTGQARLVSRGAGGDAVSRATFSPDGKTLLYEVVHKKETTSEPIWHGEFRLLDLNTAQDRQLAVEHDLSVRGPGWSPDGTHVYSFTSEGNLMRVSKTGQTEQIASLPEGTTTFSKGIPELPQISADEKYVTFTVSNRGCPRVGLVNVAEKRFQLLDENECGLHPVFVPGNPLRIAYVGYPLDGNRVPRIRDVTGAASAESLGFDQAMTYRLFEDGDSLITLIATPSRPRTFVRISIADRAHTQTTLYDPTPAEFHNLLGRSFVTTVASFDGLKIPVRVFVPSCRAEADQGPAVLYVHGSPLGDDDVSPRVSKEIGYLLKIGVTVIAVNYRGSSGYGEKFNSLHDPNDQARDALAALSVLPDLPEVDDSQVYALGICFGAEALVPRMVAQNRAAFRGVISWAGPNMPWSATDVHPDNVPDVLWLPPMKDAAYVGMEKPVLAGTRALAVTYLDDTHMVMYGKSRALALDSVRKFIAERSTGLCAE